MLPGRIAGPVAGRVRAKAGAGGKNPFVMKAPAEKIRNFVQGVGKRFQGVGEVVELYIYLSYQERGRKQGIFDRDDDRAEIIQKKQSDFKKRSRSFRTAKLCPDPGQSSFEEDRFLIVGFGVGSRILCCRRDDAVTGMVSARKATDREQQMHTRKNGHAR